MGKYFDKFPLINYDGSVARNILSKVDFTDVSARDIYSAFDFVLTEESSRSDLLSEVAYDSPMYDWLIYLTNAIIDPYHDYHMSEDKFNSFLKSKYESFSAAENTILYYRNNWAPDDSTISESTYEALSNAIQKYYKPDVDIENRVLGYVRIKEDWIVSTNKIIKLYVDDVTEFEVDQRITQDSTSAKATIIKIEEDSITGWHVEGAFEEGPLGETDITTVELIQQNISDEEASFWSPVSAYEKESEDNESRKYISLIKAGYLQDVEKIFLEQIKK